MNQQKPTLFVNKFQFRGEMEMCRHFFITKRRLTSEEKEERYEDREMTAGKGVNCAVKFSPKDSVSMWTTVVFPVGCRWSSPHDPCL